MTSAFLNTVDRFPTTDNGSSSKGEDILPTKPIPKSKRKSFSHRPRLFSNQSYIPRNPDNNFLPFDADDIISCCNSERLYSYKGSAPFTSVNRRDRAFALDGLIWRSKFRPGDGDQVGPADYHVHQWPNIPFKTTAYIEKANIINKRTRRGDDYWERKGMIAKQGILGKGGNARKKEPYDKKPSSIENGNTNNSSKPETS